MTALLAIIPWVLFGIMVLFGIIFAIVAWRSTRRANDAEERADRVTAAYQQMEARAMTAESLIQQANQRAQIAEQQIAHAEEKAQKARDVAKAAEQNAEEAARRAEAARAEAQRADSQLQARRDDADDKVRKAEQRARSLLAWAKQQWEARRETDRQKAQGQQGSFQAQLDAYLEYRRLPITFRAETEIDRMCAPMMTRFATDETVDAQGDLVRITFPVDAAAGFRA